MAFFEKTFCDSPIHDQELFNFDFGLVENSVNAFYDGITTEQFDDVNSPEQYLLMRYINKFRDVYNKAAEGIDITSKIACGTDYNHINIDTKGNAYFCHNCSDKIGTIANTISELFDVYRQRGVYELTNSVECVACEARPVCCGGCPFVDREQRRSYYCQIQRTIVAAVVRTLYRLHGGLVDAI